MSPAECGARLAALFPALFGPEGPRKPIKLRIQADLQVRAPGVFSKRVLGLFLSRYTTTTAYLRALSTAPQRVDLDGQPAGDIAEEHRAAAVVELERRREIVAARRAAERAAARPPRGERSAGDPGARPAGPAPREGDAAPSDRPPRRARSGPPAERGAGPRPERRPDDRRPERPARGDRDHDRQRQRPADRHTGQHADRRPSPQAAGQARAPAAEAPLEIADPAQRERAMLLRQFESSPLTKANFCVLKRITEAELDAVLTQARAEQPKAAARRRP
jgi:sRNA-binding protein